MQGDREVENGIEGDRMDRLFAEWPQQSPFGLQELRARNLGPHRHQIALDPVGSQGKREAHESIA